MGLLFDGYEMPPREVLGDLDQTPVGQGMDNQPQDPWQHQQMLSSCRTPRRSEMFTFTTSSKTGRRAVGNLLRHYRADAEDEPERAAGDPARQGRVQAQGLSRWLRQYAGLRRRRPAAARQRCRSPTRRSAPTSTTRSRSSQPAAVGVRAGGLSTPGGIHCAVRLLTSQLKGEGRMHELFSDDPAKIDAFIQQWDVPGRAVYACINPLKPGSTSRCIENIARIERIHVDIDFKDLVETPDEIDSKLLRLPVQPTVVRDSGGGRHAIHELREPIEADDPEMFERACDLIKRLTACLSGDPMPAHPAALLRVEGTHNTKRGEPILVQAPMGQWRAGGHHRSRGHGGPVTRRRHLYPQAARGARRRAVPRTPKHTPGVPVDIEARLAAMKLGGGLDGVHMTQLDCAREMMETGSSVEFAVDFILEATRAAVGEAEFSRWNVAKERLWLEEKCYSWVTKNPRLSATLPKGLREQFESKHAQRRGARHHPRPRWCGRLDRAQEARPQQG